MNHVEEFKSIIDNFGKKVQIITESVVYSSKPVSKVLQDGSHFYGIVNSFSGEPVKGVLTTKAGRVYEGSFDTGCVISGECVVEDIQIGSKFIGIYRDGLPLNGTLVTPTFSFHGEFNDGMPSYGKLARVDGEVYEGEFGSDQENYFYQGTGKLSRKDKSIYTGSFVCNKEHGIGSYVSVDGYSYSGVFSQGLKSGEGKETTSSGESYEGQFHNNLRHGQGILSIKAGSIFEGPFRAGTPIDGKWQITFPVSSKYKKYTGLCQSLIPHGNGTMIYKNGDCYVGDFQHGLRHGEGLCIYQDGDNYEGAWVKDEPQGLQLFEQIDHSNTTSNEKFENTIPSSTCEIPSVSLIEISFGEDLNSFEDTEESSTSYEESLNDLQSLIYQSFSTCFKIDESNYDFLPEKNITRKQPNYKDLPLIVYSNGDKFYGETDSSGNRSGFGRYHEICSSSTYEGWWKDGIRNGKGILICGNAKYCGNFSNDKKEGKGTLILNDASSYTGDFSEGLYHGHGTLCSSDNSIYSGEWVKGQQCGIGELTLSDGSFYVGDFLFGKRHGIGILYCDTSRKYVLYSGEWKHNQRDGEGISFYRSKEKDGQLNSVRRYEGSFLHDQFSGHGVLYLSDKIRLEGQWLNDNAISGDWELSTNDGSTFSGEACCNKDHIEFLGDKEICIPFPHGSGTMKYQDGSVYSGLFEKGVRQGIGTCVFANGERWEGSWNNDAIDMNTSAKGKLVLADGTSHEF